MGKFRNKLAGESSLYLQQHASNPVNWHPWGDEALSAAKKENKLLLISIGYSSCHWCHVMERESFENEEIAEVMNRNFICIKVDREERPDLDNTYMTAVQILNHGSGGWPLNCIALPDGRPIWGGTYFRPQQWKEMLTRIAGFHRQNGSETEKYAAELAGELVKATAPSTTDRTKRYTITDLKAGVKKWSQSFDTEWGGQTGAPKFPMPVNLTFLMKYAHLFQDSETAGHVKLTLKRMAAGGIYDQAGGGFARYSVDSEWYVPHFEKMLYDNAQLLALYSDAWLIYHDEQFRDVVYQSVEFLRREMLDKNSLFCSSIDADSEGEEGRFYVWKPGELDGVNLRERELFDSYYLIERDNLWEGKYHLLRSVANDNEFAQQKGITGEALAELKRQWRDELLKARALRTRPVTDNKTITSWNALMAEGLISAGRAFKDDALIDMAVQAMEAITGGSNSGSGRLRRLAGNNGESAEGYLDDYAFTIRSAISLGEVTSDERWTDQAVRLTDYLLEYFYNTNDTLFWYSRKDSPVVLTNHYELYDNVIPSSNSVMASNLFRLSMLGRGSDYGAIAENMMNAMAEKTVRHPYSFAGWASLFSDINLPFGQIVVTGPKAKDVVRELARLYLPNSVMAAAEKPNAGELFKNRHIEGKTAIYLCIETSCELPVSSTDELMPLLRKLKP